MSFTHSTTDNRQQTTDNREPKTESRINESTNQQLTNHELTN